LIPSVFRAPMTKGVPNALEEEGDLHAVEAPVEEQHVDPQAEPLRLAQRPEDEVRGKRSEGDRLEG